MQSFQNFKLPDYNFNLPPYDATVNMESLYGSVKDYASNFTMTAPTYEMPSFNSIYESDLMKSNMTNIESVMQCMRNKGMMQHITLLVSNILFDMLEQSLEFDDDSLSDQVLRTFQDQTTDCIQRARWVK